MKKALILVDLQNDFLPGGSLAVPEGDQVIPIANKLLDHPFDLKLATQDWHPKYHGSFASTQNKSPGEIIQLGGLEQVLWPDHCVQYTPGAELSKDLHQEKIDRIFQKGTDLDIDSYSTFFDNGFRRSTGLSDYLKEQGVTDLYIAGLATDYCVLYSVIDARHLGFNTYVIVDGCRGVNLKPDNSAIALSVMRNEGAKLITLKDALK